jgi:hypothetical protein
MELVSQSVSLTARCCYLTGMCQFIATPGRKQQQVARALLGPCPPPSPRNKQRAAAYERVIRNQTHLLGRGLNMAAVTFPTVQGSRLPLWPELPVRSRA